MECLTYVPAEGGAMSQRTASRWVVTAVAAALACAIGCIAPERPSGAEDPILGGRPIPIAKANTPRPKNDDPLLLPPSDAGRSPAALTNNAESSPKREETPPDEVSRSSEAPAKEPAKEIARTGFTAAPETFEQLQQQLQSRGVTWQQLKTSGNGEWVFSCAIPDPRERGIERTYHGKATGGFGLAAIKAALEEIEADRKQRGEQ
jgi:hypothetical protein